MSYVWTRDQTLITFPSCIFVMEWHPRWVSFCSQAFLFSSVNSISWNGSKHRSHSDPKGRGLQLIVGGTSLSVIFWIGGLDWATFAECYKWFLSKVLDSSIQRTLFQQPVATCVRGPPSTIRSKTLNSNNFRVLNK